MRPPPQHRDYMPVSPGTAFSFLIVYPNLGSDTNAWVASGLETELPQALAVFPSVRC